MKPKAAYTTLTQVINQLVADTMDENTITSLRSMLDMPNFQPIREVIENKIIEVGNFLKSKESEKPKTEIRKSDLPPVQLNYDLSEEECCWAPFEYDERDSLNCSKSSLDFNVPLPTIP